MVRQLIIVPLKFEWDHLAKHLSSAGVSFAEVSAEGRKFFQVPSTETYFALGGHGKVQCALNSFASLQALGSVHRMILAGSAGSLAEEVKPFDVVLAEATVEHDYRECFRLNAQLPKFSGDSEIVNQFRGLTGSDGALAGIKTHFGTLASGDEDVVSHERGDEIQKLTGALAVAWEGAGAARAAKLTKTPFLEIRAITDSADHTAVKDWELQLNQAMASLSRVLLPLVNSQL